MSQASNKVTWCLNKAQKELKEQGIHRGLIKTKPDVKRANKHLTKAQHNLRAADYFNEGGFSDWSASAFFYSIYHCFLAIIAKHGYESRNQECTIAIIENLNQEKIIEIDQKYLDTLRITKVKEVDHSIIQLREEFQYGTQTKYQTKNEFQEIKKMCQQAIEKATELTHQQE